MTEHQKTLIWSRLFLYLLITDLLLITLGISGRLLLDWQPLTAFHLFFYGTQFALFLALIGLFQLLFGLFKKQKSHVRSGALLLSLGLVPFVLAVLAIGASGFKAPMIHDISTDMDKPPLFSVTNSLRSTEDNSIEYAGETIAVQQRKAFPDIQTFFSTLTPSDARTQALRTIETLGWVLIVNDKPGGNIEAYEKSIVFGFIDDVVIRISADGMGSKIDVRSVSRVGVGDLGANAERIRRFLALFGTKRVKED